MRGLVPVGQPAFALALALALALPCRGAEVPAAVDAGAAGSPDSAWSWQLRVRQLRLDPRIVDTIGLFVSVEPLGFTQLDLTWWPRPDIGLEVALTLPQAHRVLSAGFEVARLRQLPPTLVLLWQPGRARVRPYLGAGLSYTRVSNLRFAPAYSATLQPTPRNHSLGAVLAFGVDITLAGRWSLNFDAKRLRIQTDLDRVGDLPGDFRVRPWLSGVGLGLRF